MFKLLEVGLMESYQEDLVSLLCTQDLDTVLFELLNSSRSGRDGRCSSGLWLCRLPTEQSTDDGSVLLHTQCSYNRVISTQTMSNIQYTVLALFPDLRYIHPLASFQPHFQSQVGTLCMNVGAGLTHLFLLSIITRTYTLWLHNCIMTGLYKRSLRGSSHH